VAIIWAPQSGTRIVGCESQAWAVGGGDLRIWGASWTPPAGSGVKPQPTAIFFVYTDKIWANCWPPVHKHTAAEMGKSGQIWDTKPNTGRMGVPGELWFFSGTPLKIGNVPENHGRMVALRSPYGLHTSLASDSLGDILKIIYFGFEKALRSLTYDFLRYINILTYLLTP